jgi:dTDP-D-glucose 4,6-dehydratase
MKDRQWDTSIWIANNQVIKSKLGWQPKYDFEQGFRKMVDWFFNNPTMLDHYRKSIS